ncbi:Uncharacterized protein Fot_39514 [Forsythia ovata]|uniref:Uncharacterized protein n=1 Tax=Forsythia ovata TaxID=205694 RepID=A0ABD1S7L6_9LAMI
MAAAESCPDFLQHLLVLFGSEIRHLINLEMMIVLQERSTKEILNIELHNTAISIKAPLLSVVLKVGGCLNAQMVQIHVPLNGIENYAAIKSIRWDFRYEKYIGGLVATFQKGIHAVFRRCKQIISLLSCIPDSTFIEASRASMAKRFQ